MKAHRTIKTLKANLKSVGGVLTTATRSKFYVGNDRKALQALLRDHGFHSTEGRLMMLSVLKTAKGPLTASEITERCNGFLNEVNVYRAIQSFIGAGMVRLVDLQTGHAERYELDDDHHHHIVCTSCGTAKDFEMCTIDQISDSIRKQVGGFAEVNSHSFELFGTCNSCVHK